MPAIAGAGILVLGEAIKNGEKISTAALITGGLTFFTALAAIAFLMALVKRISFTPFVLYRLALGGLLLVLVNQGIISG